MKRLGFHYHVPFWTTERGLTTSSFQGVFLDSLADKCEHLTVFGYDAASRTERDSCNYTIRNSNVSYVSLGLHTSVPSRIAKGLISMVEILRQSRDLDCVVVRAPTPLIPFLRWSRSSLKIALLIVGDYKEGLTWSNCSTIRQRLIYVFNHWIDKSLKTFTRQTLTLVNSRKLYDKYSNAGARVFEVKTTTLTADDFFERRDWDGDTTFVNVLYTGRILPEKRIDDILKACITLSKKGVDARLHLAGNLVSGHENYVNELANDAARHGYKHFYYHGLKKVGAELNEVYRMAHIYVIASANEGFPRTVWEAMANGVPVIATNVGSIPFYLRDGIDALIIEPGAISRIIESVNLLIENASLRRELIKNGLTLAKENTLDIQSGKLISIIDNEM